MMVSSERFVFDILKGQTKRHSQKKEVEDKVQGYRTKVEERREHPPWLYVITKVQSKVKGKVNARSSRGFQRNPILTWAFRNAALKLK